MEDKKDKSKFSRRDFLKYSAGVAAAAAGAAAVMGKIPLPSSTGKAETRPPAPGSDPIVVSVSGEELTVMTPHGEVKVRDAVLAGAIAEKAQ